VDKAKILVVDDEEDILELVRYNLEKEGYEAECVTTGEEAIAQARSGLPNLIILDLMLPGVDGLDVCRTLKNDAETSHIPIVMLTAKGEESDIVVGLELGADDYIVKPFSPKVLIARIRAVLRRKKVKPEPEEMIEIHNILIDPKRYKAFVKGKPIDLTATEFGILQYLARRPGWVFTRNQIIETVKGDDYPVTDRSVDVHIVSLRKKLGDAGEAIETVRGIGYRFKE